MSRLYYLSTKKPKKQIRRGPRGPRGPRGFTGPMGLEGPPGASCCPCSGNLVQNTSFETFTSTLPEHWYSNTPSVIFGMSSANEVHSGRNSVVFQFSNNIYHANLYQDINITANCCYDFQFFVRGTEDNCTNGVFLANVHFLNQNKEIIQTPLSISVMVGSLSSNCFSSYRHITTLAPQAAAEARIEFIVNGTGKTLCLDDVIFSTAGCGSEATQIS